MKRFVYAVRYGVIGVFFLQVPKHFAPRLTDLFFWVAIGCFLGALYQLVLFSQEPPAEKQIQSSGKE